MRFVYQAVRDFCKGPEWLYQVDSEKLNDWLRQQIRMVPWEELKSELTSNEFVQIKDYMESYRDSYGVQTIKHYFSPERRKAQFIKKITFNGWLLPSQKEVIALSPVDAPFKAFRRKKIVLFEAFSGKGRVAKRQYLFLCKAAREYVCLYRMIMGLYFRVALSYRNRISKFTQIDAWNHYLNK